PLRRRRGARRAQGHALEHRPRRRPARSVYRRADPLPARGSRVVGTRQPHARGPGHGAAAVGSLIWAAERIAVTTPLTMVFAWQGLRLDMPAEWNPVRLEGPFDTGQVLIADMIRPRLGLRWQTVNTKNVTEQLLRRTIVNEVGAKAAEEARALPPE